MLHGRSSKQGNANFPMDKASDVILHFMAGFFREIFISGSKINTKESNKWRRYKTTLTTTPNASSTNILKNAYIGEA